METPFQAGVKPGKRKLRNSHYFFMLKKKKLCFNLNNDKFPTCPNPDCNGAL